MKVTRSYEIDIPTIGSVEYFVNTTRLPRELISELVEACTRYLDAGEMQCPLYLQVEEIKIRGEPTYSWVIWDDRDRDPSRPPIYGPVDWSGKELDYNIEW